MVEAEDFMGRERVGSGPAGTYQRFRNNLLPPFFFLFFFLPTVMNLEFPAVLPTERRVGNVCCLSVVGVPIDNFAATEAKGNTLSLFEGKTRLDPEHDSNLLFCSR